MRVFKEGSRILQFANDTGATRFKPASCECIIIFDKNSQYLGEFQKCQHHKGLSGQALLDDIFTHNAQFTNPKIDAASTLPANIRSLSFSLQDIKLQAIIANNTLLIDTITNIEVKEADAETATLNELDRIKTLGKPVKT